MSKRKEAKYPALEKGLNVKSRKDFIEVDYVNGVKNSNGEQVIRPLNDEEKAFLNQFYEETVVTNFSHDARIKHLNRRRKDIIEDEVVKNLKEDLKSMQNRKLSAKKIREMQEVIKETKKQNEEMYADDLRDIEQELADIREEVLLYPDKEDHKEFYKENNNRNACIYNIAKKTYKLMSIDSEEYELEEKFSMSHSTGEESLIFDLERDSHENEGKRLDKAHKKLKRENKRKKD